MKRIGFGESVLFTLGAAVLGGLGFAALKLVVAPVVALAALVTACGGSYCLYLIVRSGTRSGRFALPLAWCAVAAVGWFAAPGVLVLLFLHAGMVWLVRALTCHARVLTALVDLVLMAAALALAIATARVTNSFSLSVWTFFLVQALFVFIPPALERPSAAAGECTDAGFRRALRQAEAAVRRLHATP